MKLSIITINRNHKKGLAATIKSAEEQTFRDFEHIIIDGASTDGGAELAREYAAANPSFVKCVSEPDSGVYNAMNKGVAPSSGEYVQFLNSGDTLAAPDTLARVFAVPRSADIVYGDTFYRERHGGPSLVKAPPRLTPFALYSMMVCHQAELYRRELFAKFGAYDESIKIVADSELSIRFLRNGATDERLGFALAVFEGGGVSAVPRFDAEREAFWNRFLGASVRAEYEYMTGIFHENRRLARELETPRALWPNFVASMKWQFNAVFRKQSDKPPNGAK